MKRDQVFEFFRRLAEDNPAPTTELEFTNPYTLLVAVVLSAQATDAGVNSATRPLFAQIRTPAQMVALGEDRLRDAIKTIGLFNTKARNVIAMAEILIEQHGGGLQAAQLRQAIALLGRSRDLETTFRQEAAEEPRQVFVVLDHQEQRSMDNHGADLGLPLYLCSCL